MIIYDSFTAAIRDLGELDNCGFHLKWDGNMWLWRGGQMQNINLPDQSLLVKDHCYIIYVTLPPITKQYLGKIYTLVYDTTMGKMIDDTCLRNNGPIQVR